MSPAPDTTHMLFHCSFCGKPQTEVKKLIMGPGVGVCNECVALCVAIIDDPKTDAVPDQILTPEKMPPEQLTAILKGYNKAFESVDTAMQQVVDILREREVSWATIGETLGISRQAAWKRFG